MQPAAMLRLPATALSPPLTPYAMSLKRSERLSRLLERLQRAGTGLRPEQLLELYGDPDGVQQASLRRKLQRDLGHLRGEGLVAATQDGGCAIWRAASNTAGPFQHARVMPAEDALLIKMALANLSPALPTTLIDRLRSAEQLADRRLSGALAPGDVGWAGKVRVFPDGYQLAASRLSDHVMHSVHTAIERNQRVSLSVRERGRDRTVECTVLGLLIRPPQTKLVVCERSDVAPYVINAANIIEADVLHAPSLRPDHFDLDQWLADGGDAEPFGDAVRVHLRLRSTFRLAALWQQHALGDEQVIQHRDGHAEVSATVMDSLELRRYLLSLGAQVRVLEPHNIRAWLDGQFRAALDGELCDPMD